MASPLESNDFIDIRSIASPQVLVEQGEHLAADVPYRISKDIRSSKDRDRDMNVSDGFHSNDLPALSSETPARSRSSADGFRSNASGRDTVFEVKSGHSIPTLVGAFLSMRLLWQAN
ncbi:hypothetical protein [Allochromatium tepidum]|uniref:hypothetical protein n=1 Tax=Allochromatium tepidum TaxID=553982 RepID=UPI001BCFF83D|nr:hypothetical protein [Allochromatium tepidum]